MKLKLLAVFGAIMLFASSTIMGEDSFSNHQLERLVPVRNTKKHRLPSNVYIEYMVMDDGIQFFPSDVYNEADVTVSDATAMVVAEGKISEVAGYFIPASFSTGEYSITLTTDGGSLFVGTIDLE